MTDSFVIEFPLKTKQNERIVLLKRFEAGRFLYNVVLGEGLNKIKLMKESKLFKKAKNDKALYKQVLDKHDFSEYAFHAFIKKHQEVFSDKIDSSTAQKIATRAFLASKEYYYNKRGRPRFKSKNQLISIEGKSNETGIKLRDNNIVWKGLVLPLVLKKNDPVQKHALSCRTKYVRLVVRKVKSKLRFYTQIVLEGKPYIKEKNKGKNASVGLDIGPSTIAIVSEKKAKLTVFAKDLNPHQDKKRKIQKKMARSLKITNPKNYNEDGTIKPKSRFKKSKKYLKYKDQNKELKRKIKEQRKTLLSTLANEVINLGYFIKTEKLSYKSFQKMFGRSVDKRAPGTFIKILRYKAENAGGKVFEFSTHKLKLSQRCHNHKEDKFEKKKLSDRHHNCFCKITAQRDLYSAYLALFVKEDLTFDRNQAIKSWPSAEMLLGQALSECNQTMSGKLRLSSFGLNQRSNGSSVKSRQKFVKILDVVAKPKLCESQKEMDLSSRTLLL